MPDHGGEDKGENIGQHKVQDQQNQNVSKGIAQNLKGIRISEYGNVVVQTDKFFDQALPCSTQKSLSKRYKGVGKT